MNQLSHFKTIMLGVMLLLAAALVALSLNYWTPPLPTPTPAVAVAQATSPLPTPPPTSTPTSTPTPTQTPTPTLDLSQCNAAGCGPAAIPLPTADYSFDCRGTSAKGCWAKERTDRCMLLAEEKPTRRVCEECPANPYFSEAELNTLVGSSDLADLKQIVRSQEPYEITPGIVYLVFEGVHHVVVDLTAPGYTLRNIIPDTPERGTLITPSYCFSPRSLVVVDGDYHGLNGSNKTETGREIFYHQGWAALFKRDGQFDLDLLRDRAAYEETDVAWGGGPIFIWEGRYEYNPLGEWFTPEALAHYEETCWSKISVALSADRRYLFISSSYDLTLEEHAHNIIELGRRWGITVERAMRFDGSESAYLAIRLGETMTPVLGLEEPLIVNCLAIEAAGP